MATGARVSDEEVERYLIWGRNYGEIESFKRVADKGRKWLIVLPPGTTATASGMRPGFIEGSIVPDQFVLTSREALSFGFGLAVAGARPETRDVVANREWGWDDE